MKHLFRSPVAWICATIISVILCTSAFHFFPKALPFISIDITMNLHDAQKKAQELAKKYNWGPKDYHCAAQFKTDHVTTTFVELEGGGKDALDTMISQELYVPYTWQVRHFKEFETNETLISFTPQGKPYGFIETISENLPGAQLDPQEAEKIAQKHAIEDWNIDFSVYTRIEASQHKQPSSRIDHTFIYERTDVTLGEGLYRLSIRVSGDKVTQLAHFVHIPESFTRRYENMRSANNTIAQISFVIALLLFGSIIALFFFIRRPWFIWKQPLLWGIFLATISVLVNINALPTTWMYYQTLSATSTFIFQQILAWIQVLFFQTCSFTLILIAAETLTNRAFAYHPQLWSLWTASAASSYQVLGRTLGGYLFAGFNIAFVIFFYLITHTYFGWWNPSSPLFDPNILATYVPWFSPLAQALNAAFLEEALFRAIPLAGAALIGQRYGKNNFWLTAGLIIQALIFGCMHANYPAQPSYARIVELFIPSLLWGITYLRFGLLPVIITHFIYDVIWMSLPLFISHGTSALINKVFVIIASLIPLLIVLFYRKKQGAWTELAQTNYNNMLIEPEAVIHKEEIPNEQPLIFSNRRKIAFYILGIIGALTWSFATPWKHDGVTVKTDRDHAIQQANTYLAQNSIVLNNDWYKIPYLTAHGSALSSQHRFIWAEGDKPLYTSLLNNYLEPAHWSIRYVQFEGDIVQRAEQYYVMPSNGTILRFYHNLPESAVGEQLTQNDARTLAHSALLDRFAITTNQIEEISAQEIKRPNRRDWFFTFSDTNYPLKTGKAYIYVTIAGDTISDATRSIHVPEQWIRNDVNRQQTNSSLRIFFMLLFVFLSIALFIKAGKIKHHPFSFYMFVLLSIISFIMLVITKCTLWQTYISSFITSEPFLSQLLRLLASQFIISIATVISLSFMIINSTNRAPIHHAPIAYKLLGICAGLLFAAINALLIMIFPKCIPLWPDYSSLQSSVPSLVFTITQTTTFLWSSSVILLLTTIFNKIHNYKAYSIVIMLECILFGLNIINGYPIHSMPIWLTIGTITGITAYILYKHLFRFDSRIIIITIASITSLNIIQHGIFNAYPYAYLTALIAVIMIGTIALGWCTIITYKNSENA